MMFKMPPMNNVPIVGQPFKVFECIPTAIMQCSCKPDNPPITISGIEMFKRCENCMKIYGIINVNYDRKTGGPVFFTIGIINMRSVSEVKDSVNEPANLA